MLPDNPPKATEGVAPIIRPYSARDESIILAINSACQPAVGPMDSDKLALFNRIAPFVRVVDVGGVPVGFLIGLDHSGDEYTSPNYRWFAQRHTIFAYVDRIALAPSARGLGVGRVLYTQFAQWAGSRGIGVVCAEVNTIPDNPASHAFHLAAGFAEVARFQPYRPEDEVAMYEMPLGSVTN